MIKTIILIVVLSLSVCLTVSKEEPTPFYPLNDNYNRTFLSTLDSNVFIKQAFSYIFIGNESNSNSTSPIDEFTLDQLLELGLGVYLDQNSDDDDALG